MAKFDQVFESKVRRPAMVEDDIRDPFEPKMPGNGNYWQVDRLYYGSIDGDEAFDTSFHKQCE